MYRNKDWGVSCVCFGVDVCNKLVNSWFVPLAFKTRGLIHIQIHEISTKYSSLQPSRWECRQNASELDEKVNVWFLLHLKIRMLKVKLDRSFNFPFPRVLEKCSRFTLWNAQCKNDDLRNQQLSKSDLLSSSLVVTIGQ